ncbi:MAG: polyprenol monophosphomannose synthase [Patescibacteria group bacterium]|jgi:dolichol-phosphate mannosyltransferase
MKTLVIIPTYNEQENLARVAAAVLDLGLADLDILVVDDASPDGTGRLADGLAAAHPGRVSVLHRSGKLGLGTAYLEGFRLALERGYDAACEMDADGSHDPQDLPRLISSVAAGADLAIGSRRIKGGRTEGWPAYRNLISSSAMKLTKWALGLRTEDVTAGFRCYRAALLRKILQSGVKSNGYSFQEETLYLAEKNGFQVAEIPVVFRDRRFGSSKLTKQEVWQFFATIWRLRRQK